MVQTTQNFQELGDMYISIYKPRILPKVIWVIALYFFGSIPTSPLK